MLFTSYYHQSKNWKQDDFCNNKF